MLVSHDAPQWATQIQISFRSGASSQFIVHGNVNDRMAADGQLVNVEHYIRDELLGDFDIVFTYDLGNGLAITRGIEKIAEWVPFSTGNLPKNPLEAVRFISRYVRYLANLNALDTGDKVQVAVLIRAAAQLLPASNGSFEHGALTAIIGDWGSGDSVTQMSFASILITDNLADLEPLVAFAPHVTTVRIPLPSANELQPALAILQKRYPKTISSSSDLHAFAASMVGVSIRTLEQLTKIRAYNDQVLQLGEFFAVKKEMVEHDAQGLVEFLQPTRSFDDYHGHEALKRWLRQDIGLWNSNDLRALPMGYLLCGPVGTGKTFLVECLAGEVGVPIVKLNNFREKWVGSSESNLEKVFRLVRALGRCIVFVDEADQTLGRRDSGIGDGGLSGRLYSMIAQEMSDSANRGKVIWVLASSRPDLLEVDLKRPGRVDLKIPVLPTSTLTESADLLIAMARRYNLELLAGDLSQLSSLPQLLTPGAAESLIVKAYRMVRTEGIAAGAAVARCLENYQNPVPHDVLEMQMRLAIREATDLSFVPEALQYLAKDGELRT